MFLAVVLLYWTKYYSVDEPKYDNPKIILSEVTIACFLRVAGGGDSAASAKNKL